RYRAGYQGDGNWTGAKRFYVTQDGDLGRVGSELVADLGEVNMSDGATLVDFVTWAIDTFPADKHVLILSDHGMGWPGGWSDPDPGGRGEPGIPLAARLGDELYLMEIDEALQKIRDRTGLAQFEMIGLDACLMGHLEVFAALAPHARYAVASQETEPALGWAYTSFLQTLTQYPDMEGADLGRFIVESYIEEDQRIVDEQARAELLKGGSPLGGLFGLFGGPTADQVARQMGQGSTLSALDLAAMPALVESVNELAYTLQGASQPAVARARTYAQTFTSVFGKEVPPSYLDLGSFVQLLKREVDDQEVSQAADQVLAALNQAVLAEKHGGQKPGASGISLYFPNSDLYGSPLTGPQSYTAIARRFADTSLWDDYLAFHYTGRPFEQTAEELAVPEPGASLRGPGAGQIALSPPSLSDSVAAPGRPVLLSSDVQGQNIGYAYLFAGYYDQASNSIFVADRDYLESAETHEIDGVYYPVWPESGDFTLEFEWEPVVFAIDDGENTVVALFRPERYGATYEEAVYSVDGTYTYADGGESRYARLYFRDGYLRQVYGFTGESGTGAPREIIPQAGDRFTVLETWLDLDESGRVVRTATEEGDTLTFGDQMFAWRTLDAAPGQYVVGFVVEDLDGQAVEVYERITVE
ncbi:MAG: clostripain-related cysteine peptidase, partial [Anaerolineae bacterium]